MSFIRDDQSTFLIRELANEFLSSEFNNEIPGVGLQFIVVEFLKKNKLRTSLSNRLTDELLTNHQGQLHYSFDDL